MNRRTRLSVSLNALLPGFVVWLACAGWHPEKRAGLSHGLDHRVPLAKNQTSPPPPANDPFPEIVEVSGPFNWAQLESSDYRDYLANLRAIGCPEPTVRDIIIADVNDLFTSRVKALVDEVNGRFWELIIRPGDFERMIEDKHRQLRALEKERDEVFTALFGESNPRSIESLDGYAADRREQWERTADFLPEEKRERFVTTQVELERDWEDFLRTPGLTGAQQQNKRKELEAGHQLSLREWLTADEYDELRLRQSPAAGLRDGLVGLDWGEETVRAVARIQFAKEEAQAALPQQDAGFNSRMAQLQQQSEAQTRELVGPDGYAAFQRAIDSRYTPLYRVTQRLELPAATAAQAYEIRQQAEEAANRVQADHSLPAEERHARLQAIGTETQQSLSAVLGAKGWEAYENLDGGWMQHLRSVK